MSPAFGPAESATATLGPWHLFQVLGVELEWMIVDRDSLAVRPLADRLLRRADDWAAGWVSDVERPGTEWSNELVSHVIEIKTAPPTPNLARVPGWFHRDLQEMAELLYTDGAQLLPTGMHPFMDPLRETRLWPHDYSPVYQAYDRIFGCRGHGWSNLQSCHLNLPFVGDGEFGRLHAAVRLVLPLLPALAASSPIVEGRVTGLLDNRLEAYRTNSRMIPEVAGEVIPERVWSQAAYAEEILEPAYRAVAPQDPEGVLQDEYLNARGAIARFSRGSLEVRLLDTQERPRADCAVVALVVAVLRLLVQEEWCPLAEQQAVAVAPLADLFRRTLADGEATIIDDDDLLDLFDVDAPRASAGELWRHLAAEARATGLLDPLWEEPLALIFEQGTLARRILTALGDDTSREAIARVYRRLGWCLLRDEGFLG